MNEKATNVLAYQKIIEMLSEEASSALTRAYIAGLAPFTDARDVRDKLNETEEAVRLITLKGPLPLGNFYDIAGLVNLAVKGGTLSMADLLRVGYNLRVVRDVSDFLSKDVPEIPVMRALGEVLTVHKYLEEEISRCILTEDEMSDNASPELKNIRRKIQQQNEAVRARINKILGSSAGRTYLQDSIVTIRDGRYVIPVKQEYRSMVPGIIHDQSGSGQTLFIEPQSIVDMNNELRQLELEEQIEVARILRELSERTAEHHETLTNNQKILMELDLIHSKGKLALDMNAEKPEISEDGVLDLRRARHPLLDPATCVPIDVTLGEDFTALIITGPNTGGKTVTLKTCGLLAMMAQTGLHIPANPGSKVPVYRDIFADIGDEQSIEQSLSTFSSHMRNIVEILEQAGPDCLVLIDELGAGTDPTEGAALAISILETLIDRKTAVLATTHYTELKKFAVTKEGVGNASMQFDVETLSPTYKLLMGTPGRSNAFEISRKLGVAEEVVDRAQELVSEGEMAFEDVLTAIEQEKRAAETERDEAAARNREMEDLKAELAAEREKFEKEKERILREARESARATVKEAEEFSREIREELKELAKLESLGERNKRFDNSRRKIKDAAGRYREAYVKEINENPVDISDLKVGDRVKVVSMGQNGEVLSLPDKKGEVTVTVGAIKVKVKAEDLQLIIDGRRRKKHPALEKKKSHYGEMYMAKAQNIKSSVTVRGQSLEEALDNVAKYLDDAFMAGLSEVTIIHGVGEGILMKGIRQDLRHNKHVKSFRKGSYNEGGEGVTVVTLEKH